MATELVEQRVDALRGRIVALVRRDGPDLSARQMGVFLTSYLDEEAQTVRGLAAKLNVSKPAVTRAGSALGIRFGPSEDRPARQTQRPSPAYNRRRGVRP